MKTFWKQLIIKNILRGKNLVDDGKPLNGFQVAKNYRDLKITIIHYFKDFLFIVIGIFSASFGLKGFLLNNHFIDGGATGISLLISSITKIPLFILIITINIPFMFLGFKIMGNSFAIKTILAISGLALCVALVDFPFITSDKLLVALFGGMFLGAGIGFAVRGGAVIDGTEVLAIFLSKKMGTTLGDIILIINIIIFSLAAYFLSIEIALYSIITYLSASRTLDFIIEGIEEYTGVTIISSHFVEIRQMIINKMGRGVTLYSGRQGYGKKGPTKENDIVYTVITRLELNKLKAELDKIDPHAFVVMSSVKDTKGGMIKKRPLSHS
ncbi:MAG: YitT family protein [Bacteroidota bacterium]